MNYSIKQVSEETGITAHTLRYYEKIGILREVHRNDSGFREYTEDNINWIKLIKRLKNTRMPLEEIKKYVDSYFNNEDKSIRHAMLLRHKERMEKELEDIVDTIAYIDKKVGAFKIDDVSKKH